MHHAILNRRALLLALECLHLRKSNRVIHNFPEILPAVRLNDDEVPDAYVEAGVRAVEQVRAPRLELNDVQRARRRHCVQWHALPELRERGRRAL